MQFARQITTVKTIAERLKEERTANSWSQEELAAKAKVSQGTIGNVESGLRKRPRELLQIAAALNVRPEWLQNGEGAKRPPIDLTGQAHATLAPLTGSGSGTVTPLGVGVAHLETLDASTVPTLTWEELKMPLPTVCRVVLPDDALAPDLRAGDWIEVSPGVEARPGDWVLVRDAGGLFYAREYRQRRPGEWSAVASNPAFEPMDAATYGLVVVGTVTEWGSRRRRSER